MVTSPHCSSGPAVNQEADVMDVPDTNSIQFIGPMVLLCAFNVVVIFGNALVIVSVLTEERLRTVTNTFVLSLAVSDLLLGVTVLPFSSAKEVLNYWPFGRSWCNIWLAVDVCLCTSSILNLCAISFDRYLAIGYPFKYHKWLSPRRARILIAGVWTLAFIICIPPLLGWNEGSGLTFNGAESRNRSQDLSPRIDVQINPSNDSANAGGYKVFTGVIPNTANESCKTIKESQSTEDSEITIESSVNQGDTDKIDKENYKNIDCVLSNSTGYIIYSACGSFWIPMCVMVFFYWRVYVTAKKATVAHRRGIIVRNVRPDSTDPFEGAESGAVTVALRVHRGGMTTVLSTPALHALTPETRRSIAGKIGGKDLEYLNQFSSPEKLKPRENRLASQRKAAAARNIRQTTVTSPKSKNYMSISKEHKAAKTIAIIVGCFIICWAPFFTVYLLGAFCENCTHSMIFMVFFWLGYFNSALNPIIYALCSRDFRVAFQRLLTCRRSSGRRWTSTDASGGNGRVDRLIMMAQLHGPIARPPDGRKSVPAVGGILAVSMPSSVYMLRR